jgi:predicted nuclease of predicted toxin-antitoxin system
VKLLLDQNLSYRLLAEVEEAFPGSSQVRLLDLDTAADEVVWQYGKRHGFTIVTKDADFHELAMLYGAPPKIIWLKCGNRSRWYIANLLLKHRRHLDAFGEDPDAAVLELY